MEENRTAYDMTVSYTTADMPNMGATQMLTTTLNRIRAHQPCVDGWRKLLDGLGKTSSDDEPLPFSRIVEINGLDDALWCCRAEPQHAQEWRLYALRCARQVEHLSGDARVRQVLDVAERHVNGLATDEELAAASVAARAAAMDAWNARAASDAWNAAWAASRALDAAEATARAARAAAWNARAASDAWNARAASDAWNAWNAAWAASRALDAAQAEDFLKIVR